MPEVLVKQCPQGRHQDDGGSENNVAGEVMVDLHSNILAKGLCSDGNRNNSGDISSHCNGYCGKEENPFFQEPFPG